MIRPFATARRPWGYPFPSTTSSSSPRPLDRLKIDYIEGGWPGSNPKDDQFFKEIRKITSAPCERSPPSAPPSGKMSPVKKTSFFRPWSGRTPGIITIVAKTWDFHVTRALNIGLKENLALIYDTIAYLKDRDRTVFLDAEHFFDGFKSNRGLFL